MSFPPVPGRVLKKNSKCPSMDNAGPFSMKVVLMTGPRFAGHQEREGDEGHELCDGYAFHGTSSLIPVDCAGRHPDVEATEPTPTHTGNEQQRATVVRQVRLELGELGVHRGSQIDRRGPGVMNASASGHPYVERVGPAGSERAT